MAFQSLPPDTWAYFELDMIDPDTGDALRPPWVSCLVEHPRDPADPEADPVTEDLPVVYPPGFGDSFGPEFSRVKSRWRVPSDAQIGAEYTVRWSAWDQPPVFDSPEEAAEWEGRTMPGTGLLWSNEDVVIVTGAL